MEITQELLRARFIYDAETGMLTRRIKRHPDHHVGDPVGWTDKKGYLRTLIEGRSIAVHRLIWLYVYGRWPSEQLDHINGIKTDNRTANLREANNSENNCNRPVRADSSSGIKGVLQDKRTGRWRAYIQVGGRRKNLGFFATMREAHVARLAASSLHGEFSQETCHSHLGKD